MPTNMESWSPNFSVRRGDFRRAVRAVTKGLPARLPVEIRIHYADGQIHLQVPGATVSLEAIGHWRGVAFVPAKALKRLASVLPKEDPLHLHFRDGRFHIESFSFAARWQDIAASPMTIPIGASTGDLLRATSTHSKEVVVSSGLQQTVKAARQDLEKRLQRVAKILEPFGVSLDELRDLVERKLSRPRDEG